MIRSEKRNIQAPTSSALKGRAPNLFALARAQALGFYEAEVVKDRSFWGDYVGFLRLG
jgi:hypothetical protein